MQTIENELHNRRKGAAVRLEIEDCVSDSALKTLVDALDIDESFIYRIPASPLNLARLSVAYDMVDRPDLKFPPYRPSIPAEFKNCDDYFSVIRKKDRLLHHPYESFSPVEEFISKAARDPRRFGNQTHSLPHKPGLAHCQGVERGGNQRQAGNSACRA